MKYTSNAQWGPACYTHDGGITSDTHDTMEAAHAVCERLLAHGFGGEGKHFPVGVWTAVAPDSANSQTNIRKEMIRPTLKAAQKLVSDAQLAISSPDWDKNVTTGLLATSWAMLEAVIERPDELPEPDTAFWKRMFTRQRHGCIGLRCLKCGEWQAGDMAKLAEEGVL